MSKPDLDSGLNNSTAVAGSGDMVGGWERRSAEFRAAQSDHLDLRYGAADRNRIDFFKAGANAPTVLFIHGGYCNAGQGSLLAVCRRPDDPGINVA
jgi:arylformamidase